MDIDLVSVVVTSLLSTLFLISYSLGAAQKRLGAAPKPYNGRAPEGFLPPSDPITPLNTTPAVYCKRAIKLTPTVCMLLVCFLVNLTQLLSGDSNSRLSQGDSGREEEM